MLLAYVYRVSYRVLYSMNEAFDLCSRELSYIVPYANVPPTQTTKMTKIPTKCEESSETKLWYNRMRDFLTIAATVKTTRKRDWTTVKAEKG